MPPTQSLAWLTGHGRAESTLTSEAVKAECEAWFRSFNAFSPKAQKAFEKGDFCRLAALAYPALDQQRLRTACDLMMLFFTFDECTDVLPAPEARRYADIVMDALKNPNKPRPEGEPVVGEVARQFWALGIQSATPLAQKHFLETFEDYIYSIVEQASDRDDKRIRGSEEYMILRRRTIGVQPSYPMIELGMNLVDEIWDHPVIDELRRIAVDIVLLDNLFYEPSFLTQHNIVTIIMHEGTTNLSGAMEWVATRLKALTSRFIVLYEKVPWDDADAQVQEYVEGIANWPPRTIVGTLRAADTSGPKG
ncbi:Terpene cyclase [Mycena sanguinolenta]|uniref:Terpene synthase n=1 Tax=Mycena sanguinolenta TaxID=230812 RepID=A0A8H6U3Y7_9AGAR|nr:Terpene cyclase [Mycena sanguinolenta]